VGFAALAVLAVGVLVIPALGSAPAPALAHRAAAPAPAPALNRYSLVHGCYSLRSAAGQELGSGDGPFRMQAAALGVYLLYGSHGDYLVDTGAGGLQAAAAPSPAAEWRVDGSSGHGFVITDLATGRALPVRFSAASGCAVYPEAQVDATGPSFAGASPEADVLGTVEGHAHITAFEFFGGDWHCGSPWSPYGAPYALPASCAQDEQGTNGQVEDFIDWGGAPRPSDMHGWPTFVEWPTPTSLAEEGDYYTGIERAWKAGLRLMVTNLVDNEALCSIMTTRHNPCNDMQAVVIQNRDLHALQDYIDAQSGGPGKGWFRLVTDPFQARRVINEGRLAVIEGIEVSRIFGCGETDGTPQCDQAQIDAGLKEVHAMGVRTFFPVHEFDNAFGGTKMIAGSQGAIINAGNRLETGSFWTLQPCSAQDQDAEQYTVPASGPLAALVNGPLASMLQGSPLPVYGPGPQCNTRGLTSLGAYVVGQMIKQHFLIQLDHMDSKTASAALAIAEAHHYSGVVSAHCCSSPQLFQRIYATGGFVTPPVQPTSSFAAVWKKDKAVSDPRYHFGFGWGSDLNGLGDQPGPTGPPISYPFKSYDGRVTFTQEVWGQKPFDFNTAGLANYGLYADWLRQLAQVGGPAVMNDMFQGAEAYLETWERADGVPAMSCQPRDGRLEATGLGRTLRLGEGTEAALYSAGQPLSRPGRAYRYCVRGLPAGRASLTAVFGAGGRVALIAATAPGERAASPTAAPAARRLPRGARRLTGGIWALGAGPNGTRFLYGASGGRIRYVAVAGRERSRAALRSDLRAAGL